MNVGDPRLESAMKWFPPPADPLEQVYRAHERRQRQRRAAIVIVTSMVWVVIAIAAVAISSDRPQMPATTPSVTEAPGVSPIPVDVVEGDVLPVGFPSDLPLPVDARPVASFTTGEAIGVWFRVERPEGMYPFFERELPGAGWTRLRPLEEADGVWDELVGSDGRGATIIGKLGPSERLLDGSDRYDGEWDLYILIRDLP
jgi:hypothetical protein